MKTKAKALRFTLVLEICLVGGCILGYFCMERSTLYLSQIGVNLLLSPLIYAIRLSKLVDRGSWRRDTHNPHDENRAAPLIGSSR